MSRLHMLPAAGSAVPTVRVPAARVRPGLPIAALAGIGTALSCSGVLVVLGGWLAVTGRLDPEATRALGAATAAAAVATLLSAAWSSRLSEGLRLLRTDALRRLHEPTAPLRSGPVERRFAVRGTAELTELARTLEALHLRVRLADEVAAQHRRTAETASAGVFELLSGLVAAEEGARGQLAAELHDTVAQSLMLARGLLGTGPSPSDVARASEYVEDAEEQVRAVMARTRPPALREGDLAAAMRGLRLDMAVRYGLDVSVEWPDEPHALPLALAVTVYRFFQEALLNVVKHADVDDAEVQLAVDEDGVVAEVRDQGPGFDPAEVHPSAGRQVGLGLLRERARLAGGSLEVVSLPASGTVLTLRLPRLSTAGRLPVPTFVDARAS